MIEGQRISLRIATMDDLDRLVAIRATPEVQARWRGDDLAADLTETIEEDETELLVIQLNPSDDPTSSGDDAAPIIGGIQWAAEEDPEYRSAGIDIFLDPAHHGHGYGTDAVLLLSQHLFEVEGHHRLTIDPAADNLPAIRCYAKAGFQPVGIMREYELGADGTWHDGLMMDRLASDPVPAPGISQESAGPSTG